MISTLNDTIDKKGESLNSDELLEIIDHDLDSARQLHDEQMDRIQSWIDQYEGEPYGNEVDGRSRIVWKLAKKQGEALVSNLVKPFIATNEIVDMVPRTAQDVYKTDIYQKLINHFWSVDFDNNAFLKTVGRVMTKEGTVIWRIGWEKVDKTKRIVVNQMNPKMMTAIIARGGKINELADGSFEIINENIVVNRPTAKVVRNENIYIDPTADSVDDIRYLVYEYTVTLSDLRKQPELYDEDAVKKLEAIMDREDDKKKDTKLERYADDESNDTGEYNPYEIEFVDKSKRKVSIYEYWGEYDMDGDGINEQIVATVARYTTGSDAVILKMQENPYPNGTIPFIIVPLYESEFSVYGRAIADVLEDEQKAMTAAVRGIIDNMSNSNNGTKFFKKGALDTVNFNRLRKGEPYVEINTSDAITTSVMDGNFNPLPASVFNFVALMDQQAESLTGISKMLQGLPGSEVKSSTSNFSAMMSQSQIRLLDVTNNLTTGLKKMFMMWTYMAMEYLSYDEIQDITGISIPELKVKETKKLQMEFGLVDPQTMEPVVDEETFNKAMMLIIQEVQDMFEKRDVKFDIKLRVGTDGMKQIRINEILMLLQQAAPLIQTGSIPGEAIKVLVADLAENMDKPDVADMIKKYQPQPDPMQQAMAQVQLQKLQAEAKKDEALAANAMARTQNESVKTQKEALSIDADIANKYADVNAKLAKTEQDDVKTRSDAYAKVRGANTPKGGNK